MLPAIRVVDLWKQYQLGLQDGRDGTFREMLMEVIRAPIRRLRHLGGRDEAAQFWALRGVAFDVQPGEVVAVIGRNGAGKSTLLKILSRIVDPTRGRVEMRGRVASLLEVGTGFHPDLSGRENIFLNGAILGMPRAEIRRKFDAIVEFAEVARFLDTPVRHYSSGMYLRLAFSVAAHLDGEILLVDEVLAVGDVAFQRKCLGKMQDISEGGRTVLFVTHNMSAAGALCQRGILLEAGQVRAMGEVQETLKTYLSEVSTNDDQAWEVGAVTRSHGYGELARIARIEARPREREGFRHGEALTFRVKVSASVMLSPLFVGAGIDDILGQRIVTMDSHAVDFSFSVEQGRDYWFELRIPQPHLNPGRYFLSVSLFSGQIYYDVLIHAAAFDIRPIRIDSGEYFDVAPGAGSLSVPFAWTHAEMAEAVPVPQGRRP